MTLEELITRYKIILGGSAIPSSEEDVKILEFFGMISEMERRGNKQHDMRF